MEAGKQGSREAWKQGSMEAWKQGRKQGDEDGDDTIIEKYVNVLQVV